MNDWEAGRSLGHPEDQCGGRVRSDTACSGVCRPQHPGEAFPASGDGAAGVVPAQISGGRVSVAVTAAKDCFVATARVYPSYTNPPEQYLSEATASRGYQADKPTVSPREWAQTAAIGIALRNAGFGLQFSAAGDSFDSPAVDELGGIIWSREDEPQAPLTADMPPAAAPVATQSPAEPVDPLEKAMNTLCPISKYKGRTLGQVLREDPRAILWVATKFTGDPEVSAAAKLICEQSVEQSA